MRAEASARGSALALAFLVSAGLSGVAAAAPSLANPASTYCVQRGGKVEIETQANSGQKGICVLPSGTRIDEWAYFRNNHRTTH